MSWFNTIKLGIMLQYLFAGLGPITAVYAIGIGAVVLLLAIGYFFAPYRKYAIMLIGLVALSVGSFGVGEVMGSKRAKKQTVVIQKEINRVVEKAVSDVVAIPPAKRVRDDPFNSREY